MGTPCLPWKCTKSNSKPYEKHKLEASFLNKLPWANMTTTNFNPLYHSQFAQTESSPWLLEWLVAYNDVLQISFGADHSVSLTRKKLQKNSKSQETWTGLLYLLHCGRFHHEGHVSDIRKMFDKFFIVRPTISYHAQIHDFEDPYETYIARSGMRDTSSHTKKEAFFGSCTEVVKPEF